MVELLYDLFRRHKVGHKKALFLADEVKSMVKDQYNLDDNSDLKTVVRINFEDSGIDDYIANQLKPLDFTHKYPVTVRFSNMSNDYRTKVLDCDKLTMKHIVLRLLQEL